MRNFNVYAAVPALAALAPLVVADPSSKRGIVYVPTKHDVDDNTWDSTTSDIVSFDSARAITLADGR